ncbi:MAG TPA: copper chaperone PCu(A)C [Verrucomicrobiae bacterium]|nr:copper chaperone PCu(A)C [Verrucomicrobiae bacterium]
MPGIKAFGALAALLVHVPSVACPGLGLQDGWIRDAPPGAMMTAGYARLRNDGKQLLRVDGAASVDYGSVELHRTVVEQGLSRMQHGQPLVLAPGASAALDPGGWHLMLMRPTRELKPGDVVTVSLSCAGASSAFPFTVRAATE